jgi:hypothetical protein
MPLYLGQKKADPRGYGVIRLYKKYEISKKPLRH